MTPRLAMAIDDGDVGIALIDQCVGEGQADRAAADDQVIGFDMSHGWKIGICKARIMPRQGGLPLRVGCAVRAANTVTA